MADVDTMSLKDLKQLIAKAGLTLDGCIEKPDLRQRAREAQAALAAGAAEAATHTGPEEDHIDAEIADATEGLAVSTEKKQGRGGGDGDAGGADAEGKGGGGGEGGGEMSAAKKKREKKKASDARKKAAAEVAAEAAAEAAAEVAARDDPSDTGREQPLPEGVTEGLNATVDAFLNESKQPPRSIQQGVDPGAWFSMVESAYEVLPVWQRSELLRAMLCADFAYTGMKVLLTGLTERPELNGRLAVVVGTPPAAAVLQRDMSRGSSEQPWAEVHRPSSAADWELSVEIFGEQRTTQLRVPLENVRPNPSVRPNARHARERRDAPKHAVRGVFDPGATLGFVYTVGVSAEAEDSVTSSTSGLLGVEFFASPVPAVKGEALCRLINYLVTRMEEGHAVQHGQKVQSNGLVVELVLLSPEESIDTKHSFHLELPDGVQLLEVRPIWPWDTPDEWGRAAPDSVLTAKPGA